MGHKQSKPATVTMTVTEYIRLPPVTLVTTKTKFAFATLTTTATKTIRTGVPEYLTPLIEDEIAYAEFALKHWIWSLLIVAIVLPAFVFVLFNGIIPTFISFRKWDRERKMAQATIYQKAKTVTRPLPAYEHHRRPTSTNYGSFSDDSTLFGVASTSGLR